MHLDCFHEKDIGDLNISNFALGLKDYLSAGTLCPNLLGNFWLLIKRWMRLCEYTVIHQYIHCFYNIKDELEVLCNSSQYWTWVNTTPTSEMTRSKFGATIMLLFSYILYQKLILSQVGAKTMWLIEFIYWCIIFYISTQFV